MIFVQLTIIHDLSSEWPRYFWWLIEYQTKNTLKYMKWNIFWICTNRNYSSFIHRTISASLLRQYNEITTLYTRQINTYLYYTLKALCHIHDASSNYVSATETCIFIIPLKNPHRCHNIINVYKTIVDRINITTIS